MDLIGNFCSFELPTLDAPIQWDRLQGQRVIIKENDKEDSRNMIRKNIYKLKDQSKLKKNLLSKKKLYLEMFVKKNIHNNSSHELYTNSQFGSSNSFDFPSSSNNNSDDESTFCQE